MKQSFMSALSQLWDHGVTVRRSVVEVSGQHVGSSLVDRHHGVFRGQTHLKAILMINQWLNRLLTPPWSGDADVFLLLYRLRSSASRPPWAQGKALTA